MPSPNATIVFPARVARARAGKAWVTPLDITAHADAYHARQLRIALRQWLHTTGVAPVLAEDLTWAGYEALANVVDHAYAPDHPHPVMRLQAQMGPPLLRITVTDHGRWRWPTQEAGHRGYGLTAMRALTTPTHLICGTDGTTVVLFAGLGGGHHAPVVVAGYPDVGPPGEGAAIDPVTTDPVAWPVWQRRTAIVALTGGGGLSRDRGGQGVSRRVGGLVAKRAGTGVKVASPHRFADPRKMITVLAATATGPMAALAPSFRSVPLPSHPRGCGGDGSSRFPLISHRGRVCP